MIRNDRTDEPGDDPADDEDDLVWKALSNRLRRRILDLLRNHPMPTSEIASHFEESRHVVMQHLAVLRQAELVTSVSQGRIRMNYLNHVPIQQIHRRWVSQYEGLWAEALLGLKQRVEDDTAHDNQGEQRSG